MKSLMQHRSKRWWVIVGISVAIGLSIATYITYSLISWSSYQERVQAWPTTSKQKLSAALAVKATSPNQQSQKLKALKATTTYIRSSQADTCTPARFTGWQLTFDGPKQMRESCAAYSKKVGLVADQLGRVIGYLEDEARVTNLLRPALELPAKVNEASWQQTGTAWGQVYAKVGAIPVSTDFNRTKQEATAVTLALETSWKELIVAHDAKDKPRFLSAITKVQEAYSRLAGINTVSDSQLTLLTTRLQQLYSTL